MKMIKIGKNMSKVSEKKLKHGGFTLIEMLISIALISFVIMLVGMTLTTLIRTSLVSSVKIEARDESDLIFNQIDQNIRQSNPDNILVYNSSGVRKYNAVTGNVENTVGDPSQAYATSMTQLPDGLLAGANEIHILPYQSTRWICIGYFVDPSDGQGYIVKTTSSNLSNHSSCFDRTKTEYVMNAVPLSSDQVSITQFAISYYKVGGDNVLFTFDMQVKPMKSYGPVTLSPIVRQLVVSTQKLTNL